MYRVLLVSLPVHVVQTVVIETNRPIPETGVRFCCTTTPQDQCIILLAGFSAKRNLALGKTAFLSTCYIIYLRDCGKTLAVTTYTVDVGTAPSNFI